MWFAGKTRRQARLLASLAGMVLAGCGSTGGTDGVFGSDVGYRMVTRIDRSWSSDPVKGPQLASLVYGEKLRVPQMRVVHVPSSGQRASARRFRGSAPLEAPVSGAVVSSHFGVREHPVLGALRMHEGIDIAAPAGTPVRAAADGVVDFADRNGGYGNFVRIRHDGRFSTAYAHMRDFAEGVSSGTAVRRGDVIGYVGSTGRSTGPHLHFELLDDGDPVDPLEILPRETVIALASD